MASVRELEFTLDDLRKQILHCKKEWAKAEYGGRREKKYEERIIELETKHSVIERKLVILRM